MHLPPSPVNGCVLQVCSYGDRRSVKFAKLEAEGVAGGLSSLAQTPELRSVGDFSRNGLLAPGHPIVVHGAPQSYVGLPWHRVWASSVPVFKAGWLACVARAGPACCPAAPFPTP